jgi:chromosome partitioning protein
VKRVGLIAQKGGTGKTTLGIHVAVQASLAGLPVLLVDMDPQASATAWWRRRQAEKPALVQTGGDDLPRVLEEAEGRGFALAVVDTAPHSSEDARTGARLCDLVCIPTRPAILDLDAIRPTTDLVSEVGTAAMIVLNACPPPTAHGEPQIVSEAREALSVYRIPVCPAAVSQRVAFSHALIGGQAVAEYQRAGKAAAEVARLWQAVRLEVGL